MATAKFTHLGEITQRKFQSEYNSWRHMVGRCHDAGHAAFARYGAVGVVVCDRWRQSFPAFVQDMGQKPTQSHTIERMDGLKGYCFGNCRWATRKEQAANRKTRARRHVEFKGESKSIHEWAAELPISIDEGTLYSRLFVLNWPIEVAMTTPAEIGRNRWTTPVNSW